MNSKQKKTYFLSAVVIETGLHQGRVFQRRFYNGNFEKRLPVKDVKRTAKKAKALKRSSQKIGKIECEEGVKGQIFLMSRHSGRRSSAWTALAGSGHRPKTTNRLTRTKNHHATPRRPHVAALQHARRITRRGHRQTGQRQLRDRFSSARHRSQGAGAVPVFEGGQV